MLVLRIERDGFREARSQGLRDWIRSFRDAAGLDLLSMVAGKRGLSGSSFVGAVRVVCGTGSAHSAMRRDWICSIGGVCFVD